MPPKLIIVMGSKIRNIWLNIALKAHLISILSGRPFTMVSFSSKIILKTTDDSVLLFEMQNTYLSP